MSIKEIITIPNEILTQRTKKVVKIDEEIIKLSQDLLDTLKVAKDPEGAGLAANQIGESVRMCAVKNFFHDPKNPEKMLSEDFVLINPKIISKSQETDLDWEGCLSVPNSYGRVYRYMKIKVSAMGLDGNEIQLKASDFFARTIQHEIDHLDGILFTDRAYGKLISGEELQNLEAMV